MNNQTVKIGNWELTANHPRASYGQPVLLIDDVAYGPGDVVCTTPSGDPVRAVYLLVRDAGDHGPYTAQAVRLIRKFVALDPRGVYPADDVVENLAERC